MNEWTAKTNITNTQVTQHTKTKTRRQSNPSLLYPLLPTNKGDIMTVYTIEELERLMDMWASQNGLFDHFIEDGWKTARNDLFLLLKPVLKDITQEFSEIKTPLLPRGLERG